MKTTIIVSVGVGVAIIGCLKHRLCLYGRMNTKQAEYKNDTACLAEQIVQREFQAQLVSAALFAVAVTVMKP